MTENRTVSEANARSWITAFKNEPPLHSRFPLTLSNGKQVPGIHVVCASCDNRLTGDRIHGRVVQSLPYVLTVSANGYCPQCDRMTHVYFRFRLERRCYGRRVAGHKRPLAGKGAAAGHAAGESRAWRPTSSGVVQEYVVKGMAPSQRGHSNRNSPVDDQREKYLCGNVGAVINLILEFFIIVLTRARILLRALACAGQPSQRGQTARSYGRPNSPGRTSGDYRNQPDSKSRHAQKDRAGQRVSARCFHIPNIRRRRT